MLEFRNRIQNIKCALLVPRVQLMKILAQKDLDLSEMRLSQFNNMYNESRLGDKKKTTQKYQEIKRRESQKLKEIVEKQKVQQIKKQFINKLKLLVPHRTIPSEMLALQKQPNNLIGVLLLKLKQKEGFRIGQVKHLMWKLIILLNVAMLLVTTSFLLVFNSQQFYYKCRLLIQISIFMSVVDIIGNFVFQKFEINKYVKNLLSIAESYAKSDFALDFLSLVSCIWLLFDLHDLVTTLLVILTIIKLWRSIYKIEVLEHIYIVNVFHEKYYSIIRVFLFNFIIAHFIAIAVLLMSRLNEQTNWIQAKNLENADWLQKYTWAYYWAVNIMLTVGFGDFTATNKSQALVLIFVETISCIMLAYNINIVGSILTDIKEKERDRKNQLRVLIKMARENQIQSSIVQEAFNYVDQSFKIKQKFFYEDHDSIMQSLPDSLQSEYCKQINKKMMLDLPLVQFFSHKSLLKIAEKVVRKLAHPEQIIWKKGELYRLIILNKGKIGLTVRHDNNSLLNGQVIQNLQVAQNKSKIITMNFLRNQRFKYDIKSVNYSVVYHLSTEQFAIALKERQTDYEIFCALRDKVDNRIYSGELYECNLCPQNRHDYFNCPKLHLILIKGHVILKFICNSRNHSNQRILYIRQSQSKRFMKLCKTIRSEQQSYINLAQQQLKNPNTNSSIQSVVQGSKRVITSTHSAAVMSHIIREIEMQRLNSILVGRMNEQELCFGFWNVECDVVFNFMSYFRQHNAQNLKDKDFGCNRMRTRQNSQSVK